MVLTADATAHRLLGCRHLMGYSCADTNRVIRLVRRYRCRLGIHSLRATPGAPVGIDLGHDETCRFCGLTRRVFYAGV